jgi:hypothetical protein
MKMSNKKYHELRFYFALFYILGIMYNDTIKYTEVLIIIIVAWMIYELIWCILYKIITLTVLTTTIGIGGFLSIFVIFHGDSAIAETFSIILLLSTLSYGLMLNLLDYLGED